MSLKRCSRLNQLDKTDVLEDHQMKREETLARTHNKKWKKIKRQNLMTSMVYEARDAHQNANLAWHSKHLINDLPEITIVVIQTRVVLGTYARQGKWLRLFQSTPHAIIRKRKWESKNQQQRFIYIYISTTKEV